MKKTLTFRNDSRSKQNVRPIGATSRVSSNNNFRKLEFLFSIEESTLLFFNSSIVGMLKDQKAQTIIK
ncbi:unnamed protein product [Schistosoma margrebowiei]|uniref:Uncharacterized protein n=1 Tax=Schistosoma margrebowiei TaxID=48269 RepID=A0A3P7YVJ1_9TREM|nr:unnamed protein product [Schistosoma margrebowiei]